jgi:ribosome silencing factor RsfS/YbeB/iojap
MNDLLKIYKDKPQRLNHVLGVRDTAIELGKLHGCDLKKLEIAALLHDITKYESLEIHRKLIKSYYSNAEEILHEYNPKILHAFSAVVVAKNKYGVQDNLILNAIQNHTVGRKAMSIYSKIIFIADYIEPNRTYDSCKKVRKIAYENLDLAVYTAINDSILFFEKLHEKIPKTAYEARKYYYEQLEGSLVNKVQIIIKNLEKVNAQDIDVFDMREKSPFFDYLIIASVTSNRQLQASYQHVSDELVKNGFPAPKIEGKQSETWVLIDAQDVIINVFTKEERDFYDLEKMLVGIKRLKMDEDQ